MSKPNTPLTMLAALIVLLAWSVIEPRDQFTWFLEVVPVLIGVPALMYTYRRFRLTNLTYALIFVHAAILIVGGHYTYAENPLFNWLRDSLDLARNYYDRLGHFAQGFVPAIIARELLLRTSPLKRGAWLNTIVVCICLAISATYELIEWWVAVGTGTAAEAFLGTQGDVWDSQWDMFIALIGAITALFALARTHDRTLNALAANADR